MLFVGFNSIEKICAKINDIEMFPILLLINVVLCEAEWIKISQIPTSEFQRYTTPSTTLVATEIIDGDAPIKYEDLEHIIGPGFEDELEKFYQRHKEETEKRRHENRANSKMTTSVRPFMSYEEDPWSVYDNPVHISVLNEPINVADVSDSEQSEKVVLDSKHRYEEFDESVDRVSGSSNENHESVTVRPVKHRYEEYDESVDRVSSSSNENHESVTVRPVKHRNEEYVESVDRVSGSKNEDHESVKERPVKHRYEEYDESSDRMRGSKNKNHESGTVRRVKHRYEQYDESGGSVSDSSKENYENATRKHVRTPEVIQLHIVETTPTVEPFSFNGFIKFLREIQSTFVSKTARSIKEKIRTLEQFRDDILINIHDRIQNLWPATPIVRSKRGIIDGHHGGGMEFPSSEGALMTISFLTFAVFLIKLVLQVINTIKSKHYSMDKLNGAMSAVKINRNARSLSMTPDDLNGMKSILTAIDNAATKI